ncbi:MULTISPECIES: YiiX/YebB-like N1pC/P60 family cysteine hydrolase [Alphaproteobacteria]|uniref:YiiX/YebB-like N1pC/P60 family cysteine hydrolase n=1 Tax=Alphaproteobacteria TaxID=28211 RepID=UPI001479335E|nr:MULTISPECIES: YiiX/YebB-like N1pC/P60 family cysteine hydrolase [Alphaproteobacteria]
MAVLALVLLASACTTVTKPQPDASRPGSVALSDCCRQPERYPKGLVALAEPFAPTIGKLIAAVVWRKGFLLRHEPALNAILAELQPLDVIAVNNKGRLSGHAIPGHFGHVAIYVGNERQLRRAGVWDASAIRKYHEAIRSGALFIEADNKGVHLSTAPLALNADAIVQLRPTGLSAARRRQALGEFYKRVGMPFDYYFDLDTPACTFCTELVNMVLPEMRLPPRRVYGRRLILPDEVVAATIRGRTAFAFQRYVKADRNGWEILGRDAAVRDLATAWPRMDRPPQLTALSR